MDKKAYLYIVEAGQFSFEVEIKELLGKVGDMIKEVAGKQICKKDVVFYCKDLCH